MQAEKLQRVEKRLSKAKGPFEVFALLLREDSPGKWDVLISADWASSDKKAAINTVFEEMRKELTDFSSQLRRKIDLSCHGGDAMKHPFDFNAEKAIESILYIIENGTQPTFHHVSKVLYFADKEHLERYGRFICGDTYIAMKNGPVPSGVYDLLKLVRGNLPPIFYPPREIIDSIHQAIDIPGRYGIITKRKPDSEMFSDSDIECLNNSTKKYGNLSFSQLTELSHDNAWKSADQNDLMEIDHIIAGFHNPGELSEHLLDPHPAEGI